MFTKKGIKFKILLYCGFSVVIFSVFLVWLSNLYWNVLLNDKKEKLQNIVEIGSSLVKGYIDQEKKGTLSKEQAQARAKADLNVIRYSGKEYIFVTNTEAYQVLNPVKPELSGKDMSGFADPTGLKLYVEIANLAKKSGSGYIYYMFPKAGSTVPSKKLSYINYFPEWNWIVGTGLYMDDAYAAMNEFLGILLIACVFCIVTLVILGIYFANS
ncbi:MAG: cache domain-containing protein, partial [Silvanigrellaceae bacterium]|nr:cache domain-containing protein [Silvanigrellaceae bacterium]